MSLPTLAKTWQFNVNQSIGGTGNGVQDYGNYLRVLKNSLKSFSLFPWIVMGSGNGVTGALDGVDRWTVDTDISNHISNSGANGSMAWIVLKQTGMGAGNFQILLGANGSTGGGGLAFSISPNAGFTGGSATNSPTATDQAWYQSSSFTNVLILPNNLSAFNGKLHVQMANDGSATRAILCVGGYGVNLFEVSTPVNVVSGWTNPAIYCAIYPNLGLGTVANLTYAQFMRTARHSGRGGATPVQFNMFLTCEGTQASELGTQMNFANDFNSLSPMLPLGIFCVSGSGVRGRHGLVPDLYCGSTNIATGATYPGDGSKQFLQIDHFIIPWNGSVPLVA